MSFKTDQPPASNLGPTGQLLRRALPAVCAPERFRTDLLRRLVADEARGAARQPSNRPRIGPR